MVEQTTDVKLRKDALIKDLSLIEDLIKEGEANELALTRNARIANKEDDTLSQAQADFMINKLRLST